MYWAWTAVTVLMVDQRVGEMSSCRQRRVEYRATGVPSADTTPLFHLSTGRLVAFTSESSRFVTFSQEMTPLCPPICWLVCLLFCRFSEEMTRLVYRFFDYSVDVFVALSREMRPLSRLLRRLLHRFPSRDDANLSIALFVAFSQEMTPLSLLAALPDAGSLSPKR
jgi:hypothetical protein